METNWTIPKVGFIKVNTHGCFAEIPLANGNKYGVGAVLRDDKGKIIVMLTGTQSGLTKIRNQLFAMIMGLRLAYEHKKEKVILETDNLHAYEAVTGKWNEADKKELMTLQKRKDDTSLVLEVNYVHSSAK